MTTITVTGVIAPAIGDYGVDYGGFFGPAGGTIAGDPFTATWTGVEGFGSATFNPIVDATLTINGHTYDFGPGLGYYNDLVPGDVQQVQVELGAILMTTHYAGFGADLARQTGNPFLIGHDGSFYIQDTQAFLTIGPTVPGPELGAGLPGLALLAVVAAAAIRRRLTNGVVT